MAVIEDLYQAQQQNIRNDVLDPHSELPKLTVQEQMFVACRIAGGNVTEASRRAGIAQTTGFIWEKKPHIAQAINHYTHEFATEIAPRVRFTKEDAHHMYMTAYRNAANATEQIKATDSLVKLHRLNEPEHTELRDLKDIRSPRQLEQLSRRELLRLANLGLDSLTPDGETLDGEYDDES